MTRLVVAQSSIFHSIHTARLLRAGFVFDTWFSGKFLQKEHASARHAIRPPFFLYGSFFRFLNFFHAMKYIETQRFKRGMRCNSPVCQRVKYGRVILPLMR
ncbi:MAG: hypothetical protein A3I44_04355 [Candidatus Sungbacteria bacterium RIFCSPLOWO2_02_FULL_51_17]|uniref:Uncharacterized protein n=1 Tax=Candidatus Sungbacteria bacterium RIFCSPHIGHO2_02_FULL_51_29 TaxID=1802273 RepID=A0A1G2KYU7_9BACT|nr:MAG: hypothetical protein A2676_05875 [Candidatus Sungbacteria bacterium RIFCSPHIGHO2_01_FULL_51_22]OHA03672.1 MAG: hypothetical protein A3C16_03475 [Candidatus Sungbacteria bacterium RIFCSPHIGHO2_02_FULL_51_29]OHA07418.1 MAG: hypothetical protein A3B29_04800 [Candidatus Sungbacteria bacterium RIFCSPLOWO2_01_FULL_51_34]OHA11307.1 MAG: hypothetical protein A3I44_04355 [Candidatus Sungbacteria bacterium RIFCSPLOWO2_02_FULL_51_17]